MLSLQNNGAFWYIIYICAFQGYSYSLRAAKEAQDLANKVNRALLVNSILSKCSILLALYQTKLNFEIKYSRYSIVSTQ